jgi:hypothetical protein
MAVAHGGGEGVPALLGPGEVVLTPAASIRAGVEYVKAQYGEQEKRSYAVGGMLAASDSREFVCMRCDRGQCARCRDRACTCCFGNEE